MARSVLADLVVPLHVDGLKHVPALSRSHSSIVHHQIQALKLAVRKFEERCAAGG